jgi:hypothetical protein
MQDLLLDGQGNVCCGVCRYGLPECMFPKTSGARLRSCMVVLIKDPASQKKRRGEMKHHSVIAAVVVALCLWVGCDSAFAVIFKGTLDWQTSRDEAVALAKAQGKKILLVAGRYPACAVTAGAVDIACESVNPPIRALIQQHFIPWFSDIDASSETDVYVTGMAYYYLPLICVIDPNDSLSYLDRSTGAIELQSFYARLLQYSTCALTISPSEQTFAASSNTGTVDVRSSSSTCPWTAVSNDAWIVITAGNAGTGSGTVSYSVSANAGDPRTGTMTIAGQTFTVNQNDSATCTSTITPTNALLKASPTCTAFGCIPITGTVTVATSLSSCSWNATSNDSWITITACSAHTGNGTVSYSLSTNTGGHRTGTITIAGQTFTVNQRGVLTALGSLRVTISPPGAVTAGGQWRRVGTTTWFNSDSLEGSIPVGSYTVEFKAATGWTTPASVVATIGDGAQVAASGTYVVPQTIPVLQVTPGSLNFGHVSLGLTKDLTLTVKNAGGANLAGNATTAAPFSIVSDGSYDLAPDQNKVVTIRYQPTSKGPHTGTVVFTGGDGAAVQVTGNRSVGLPWLMLLLEK